MKRASASSVFDRLISVYRTRGLTSFLLFVLQRIARHQSDIVFEINPSHATFVPAAVTDVQLMVAEDRASLDQLDSRLRTELLAGDNREYVDEIRLGRDSVFVVSGAGGELLHHSFVQHATRYKHLIGEGMSVPLIGNCFTVEKARGMRLYPFVLSSICDDQAERGEARIVITCAKGNLPSIRGIERVGFRRVREIDSIVFFSRAAIQLVRGPAGRRLRTLVMVSPSV